MARWILYLQDYIGRTTLRTAANQTTGVSAASNAINGYGTMVSALTATSAWWEFDQGANPDKMAAWALGNTDLGDHGGCVVSWMKSTNGSTWTTGGDLETIAGGDYADKLWEFNDSDGANPYRYKRLKIVGAQNAKIGVLSLLAAGAYKKITLQNVEPTYPIPVQWESVEARQPTMGGNEIVISRGGAFDRFALNIPNVKRNLGSDEGLLYDSFLKERRGIQGWGGWFWVTDDTGLARYVTLSGPISAPITTASGRQYITIPLRTCAYTGLT